MPSFGPPMQTLVSGRQMGHGWMPFAGLLSMSPVRKITEVSGLRHVRPWMQSALVVQSLPQLDAVTHCTHLDGVSEPVWVPLGADVVNLSCVGSGVPQMQALAVSHWHDSLQI